MIEAIKKHAEGHIEKHKTNVEVLMQKPAGVAEHPDHLATIEKELAIIAEYDDQIEESIKQDRLSQVIALQKSHTLLRNEAYIGNIENVLIEKKSKRKEN